MENRRLIHLIITIIMFVFAAPSAPAQWTLVSSNQFSSFDMLDTRNGLAAQFGVGMPTLNRYYNGNITGIYTASGAINSIVILDTNIAYFAVQGDGIYEASAHWSNFTRLREADTSTLLAVSGTALAANIHRSLAYSKDGGVTFGFAKGIGTADSICAVGIYSANIMVAVADSNLYRSTDGGANWSLVLDTLRQAHSVYIDHTHNIIYAGGLNLMRSLDSGAHWQELSSLFFFPLVGQVVGTNDCTGVFYLSPDKFYRGELLRSVNLGKFFQSVGPANFASTRLQKAVVMDRGSTFFWLDQSGLISVSTSGIDSTITDSVKGRVIIGIDTVLHNTLCPNAAASGATFRVIYDQCTGIILDSLKQLTPNVAFKTQFTPLVLGDATARISYTFRADHPGPDTAHYRLRFHSPVTQNVEHLDFTIPAFGDASGAAMTTSVPSVDFSNTLVGTTTQRSFTISNSGCDSLLIASITSSGPLDFSIGAKQYPVLLMPGKTTTVNVTFSPNAKGDYLESAVIETNIGTRYLTLRGSGTSDSINTDRSVAEHTVASSVYPNPAKDILTIVSSSLPSAHEITITDELGRIISPVIVSLGSDRATLDIHSLSCGLYMLHAGASIHTRFIKF